MAELKRRTLWLSTEKQIQLYGNSIAIGRTLEIGEGYAPNIFSGMKEQPGEKTSNTVSNPYKLTAEELHEIADYNIRLWMDLKDNIRKHGVSNPRIFIIDTPNKQTEKGNKKQNTSKPSGAGEGKVQP